ncbi:uncharacterized protein EI97DRAFT_127851 [Westerdykella ornata]|uniref:Uncharacterized protein n=1 Tax=Westerdykella ornata TaxID=318751 RepID=A0A6A6JEJ2_WESOR|nr:uncharacterized protein EI97DRAFT_127851 [Westerdykella ornata]KAF2274398.1 hypothetical protein EI97DRAFT_127851 [Westerdykella ornata]
MTPRCQHGHAHAMPMGPSTMKKFSASPLMRNFLGVTKTGFEPVAAFLRRQVPTADYAMPSRRSRERLRSFASMSSASCSNAGLPFIAAERVSRGLVCPPHDHQNAVNCKVREGVARRRRGPGSLGPSRPPSCLVVVSWMHTQSFWPHARAVTVCLSSV